MPNKGRYGGFPLKWDYPRVAAARTTPRRTTFRAHWPVVARWNDNDMFSHLKGVKKNGVLPQSGAQRSSDQGTPQVASAGPEGR